MENISKKKTITIVGGGFAGVRCALDLEKLLGDKVKIQLISNKDHFEYHAVLYRLISGYPTEDVCIPLEDIFEGKKVEVITDKIVGIDNHQKKLWGESNTIYEYDELVLALGSETSYYDIPGLKEQSFSFKSTKQALELRDHIHEVFDLCKNSGIEEKSCAVHFVIVGGGISGCEIAGELGLISGRLAKNHDIDSSLIKIDIVHSRDRLIPNLPEDFSRKIETKLKELKVNIIFNQRIEREEAETVYLKDMEMKSKTVIWTAGVTSNHFYKDLKGIQFDEKGKVIVNENLIATGTDVFIIGDGINTKYSGMAQSAINHGKYVAGVITAEHYNAPIYPFKPVSPVYAVPIGHNWAGVIWGDKKIYGRFGSWIRRFLDFKLFLSILPFKKAIMASRNENKD